MEYIRQPYAVAGDRDTVPVDAQPDGTVSFAQGWPIGYELDPDSDPGAKELSRTQTNETLYIITAAIQQLQQTGVSDFITTAQNGGSAFPYTKFSRVRYNNGTDVRVYESLIDSNTSLPTDATRWSDTSTSSSGVPTGVSLDFRGPVSQVPAGYLPEIGQAVSRTTYAKLFSVIGTTYGVGFYVQNVEISLLAGSPAWSNLPIPISIEQVARVSASSVQVVVVS